MTLPRSRTITLSAFQTRQIVPVTVHRGDILDFAVDFVRLMRSGDQPPEVLSAAAVSSRDLAVSNIVFAGRRVTFTVSGAQRTGEALISIAVSTDQGRTLSRTLRVPTVWEDVVIDPYIPPEPEPDPCLSDYTVAGTSLVETTNIFDMPPELQGADFSGYMHTWRAPDGIPEEEINVGSISTNAFSRPDEGNQIPMVNAFIEYLGVVNTGSGFFLVISMEPGDPYSEWDFLWPFETITMFGATFAYEDRAGGNRKTWYWELQDSSDLTQFLDGTPKAASLYGCATSLRPPQ